MLLDEIGTHLVNQGIVGGATGWTLAKAHMPPDPDQVVALFETPGLAPFPPGIELDKPGIQVRVRAARKRYDLARSKLAEVYAALHGFTGNLSLNYYVMILALSSALPLGEDTNERPEIAQNYIVYRSR